MYQYTRFVSDNNGAEAHLPRTLADDKLVTGDLIQPYTDTIGGISAWRTDDLADVTRRRINLNGSYLGRDAPLSLDGDTLLDVSDPLGGITPETHLATLWDGLASLRGHQGKLYREWIDGGDEQWALATLVKAESNVKPVNWIAKKIDVRAEFIMPGGVWIDPTARTWDETIGTGTAFARARITNNGNVESNTAVLTLTPDGDQDDAEICLAYGDVHWVWRGDLTDDQVIKIDAGAQTVEETTNFGQVSRLGGFETNEFHRARGWIPLQPGIQQLGFIFVNCEGSVELEWRNTYI